MKHFTKDELVKATTPKVKEITVEGYENAILVKTLSAYEAIQFSHKAAEKTVAEQEEMSFELIAACVVDDNGEPIFTVEEAKSNIDSYFYKVLMSAIVGANTEAEVEKAKENLEKDPFVNSVSN